METFTDKNRFQINIAICGVISAGKSTLLNSLFVSQYSDMKWKRTTMVPQVYYEVGKSLKKKKTAEIRAQNKRINDILYEKTHDESQAGMTLSDIQEVSYAVPKVHKLVKLEENVHFTVYVDTKRKWKNHEILIL